MKDLENRIKIGNIIILVFFILILIVASAQGQSRHMTSKEYHVKLQKETSWTVYQNTYKKTMLDQAKAAKKANKSKKKKDKELSRFLARLERIKE